MDSNHRRHSQQIYSLPHLATLVTTQKLLICELSLIKALFLKASAKVVLFFHSTKFFCIFFHFFLKKLHFPPKKKAFALSGRHVDCYYTQGVALG